MVGWERKRDVVWWAKCIGHFGRKNLSLQPKQPEAEDRRWSLKRPASAGGKLMKSKICLTFFQVFRFHSSDAGTADRIQTDQRKYDTSAGRVHQHVLIVWRRFRVKKFKQIDRSSVDQLVEETHRSKHESAFLFYVMASD